LIAFEKLGKLDLLCQTYDEIFLTDAVYQEYASDLQPCFVMKSAPEPISHFLVNHTGLGRGESESISLAHSTGIRVLIDDLKARKIAMELGCRVVRGYLFQGFSETVSGFKIDFHFTSGCVSVFFQTSQTGQRTAGFKPGYRRLCCPHFLSQLLLRQAGSDSGFY
jgi:hypothetical protein